MSYIFFTTNSVFMSLCVTIYGQFLSCHQDIYMHLPSGDPTCGQSTHVLDISKTFVYLVWPWLVHEYKLQCTCSLPESAFNVYMVNAESDEYMQPCFQSLIPALGGAGPVKGAWHGVWGSELPRRLVVIARLISLLPTLYQNEEFDMARSHGYAADRSRTVQMSNLESKNTLKWTQLDPTSIYPFYDRGDEMMSVYSERRKDEISFSKPSTLLESSKI